MSQEQESVDYEIAFESVHAASEWRYRAEGNANIILSYCPSSSHGDPRLVGCCCHYMLSLPKNGLGILRRLDECCGSGKWKEMEMESHARWGL